MYKMPLVIAFFCFVCIGTYSCSSTHKKVADEINTFVVAKSHFENSLNVPGILETNKSVSYTCPVSGFDIQITWLVPEGSYVHKGDTIIKLQCTELSTRFDDAGRNLDMAASDLERARAQLDNEMSLLQAQIKTNDAQTKIAMLDSTKLGFMSESDRRITELKLEKVLIEKEKLKRKLTARKEINKSTLRSLQSKIMRQERNLKQAEDKLNKLTVVSDTSGVVLYENLMTTWKKIKAGDIIWGSMPILKLVDVTSYQVRLVVNESQYQSIQVGNRAEMVLDAVKKKTFNGKITIKKPTGKPMARNSTVKQFEIVASVDSLPPNMQPGITVNCKVLLMELKDTIAIPIVTVFDEDSSKIVYVRNNDKFQKRKITTSLSSDKFIIVSKGLKPKELISLNVPPDYLLK